jgi:hypothetical protein
VAAPDILLVPSQFATIQAAVDAAAGPATIVVWPGAYDESVVVAGRESLVIQSARLSRRGVVLCGSADGREVVTVERSTLTLSGIEIRSNGRLRGLGARDSVINLQECVVAGNRTQAHTGDDGAGAGMACRDCSVRLQKSVIAGNTVDQGAGEDGEASGGGLYLERCSIEVAGSSVQANAVYSSVRARGGGIWCEGSRMRMWRSRVTDNALRAPECEGAGIYFRSPAGCELGGSVVSGNGAGEGRGGGVFVDGDPARVSIHRNSFVRQNHPDDVCSPGRAASDPPPVAGDERAAIPRGASRSTPDTASS